MIVSLLAATALATAWEPALQVDPLTDAKGYTIAVTSDGKGLMLGCSQSKPDLNVVLFSSTYLGQVPRTRIAQHRFDDGTVETQQWRYGDHTASLIGESAQRFANDLQSASRVRLRAVTATMEAVDIDLRPTETAKAIAMLKAACAGDGATQSRFLPAD